MYTYTNTNTYTYTYNYTILYYTRLYYTIAYYAILYYTILYYPILYDRRGLHLPRDGRVAELRGVLHSAKGGAVETGCSDLYGVTYYFIMQCYPNRLHPPPTAPPCKHI